MNLSESHRQSNFLKNSLQLDFMLTDEDSKRQELNLNL